MREPLSIEADGVRLSIDGRADCLWACEIAFDASGRAQMEMKFEKAGAKIALFGLKHES